MVSILPSERSSWDVLSKRLGEGIQNAGPTIQKNAETQRGLKAIEDLQNVFTPKPGEQFDQGKVLSQLAKAMALNPGMERSGIVDYVMKMAGAKAQQGLPPPGGQGVRDRSEMPQVSQRPEVNFMNQPGQDQQSQTFPNNIGPQEKTGNAPQAATKGEKVPIRTPDELRKAAVERSKAATEAGFPMTPGEAYAEEVAENEQAKLYNQEVANETNERVASQKKYGTLGESAIKKVYPAASEKMQKIFKKYGEDVSGTGKSEAQIEEYLTEKANELGAKIDNIKRSMSRPNIINNIERGMNGNYKTFDQSVADVRKHIQPLLDMGLYDDAKNLLTDLNYGPEEIEGIVNPLSSRAQTALNSLPNAANKLEPTPVFKKFKQREGPQRPLGTIEDLKEALLDLKEADPNFSPLLARRYAEDKGYDSRMFKDAWNQLLEGDQQNPEQIRQFKLTGDQSKMAGYLDTPPLDLLDRMLHGLEIKGR